MHCMHLAREAPSACSLQPLLENASHTFRAILRFPLGLRAWLNASQQHQGLQDVSASGSCRLDPAERLSRRGVVLKRRIPSQAPGSEPSYHESGLTRK